MEGWGLGVEYPRWATAVDGGSRRFTTSAEATRVHGGGLVCILPALRARRGSQGRHSLITLPRASAAVARGWNRITP